MPPRPILKKVRLIPYTGGYSTGNLGTNEIVYASGKFIIGAPGNRNYALNHSSFHAIQKFTSSGTWVKPSQGSLAIVIIVGGGGGGTNATQSVIGRGGGAGGITFFMVPLSILGATESVTVGSGGLRELNEGAGASNGGTSTFSTWMAFGGGAGQVSQTALDQINTTTASRGNIRQASLDLGGINRITSSTGIYTAILSLADTVVSSGGNGGASAGAGGTNGSDGYVLILTV